jgi:transposase
MFRAHGVSRAPRASNTRRAPVIPQELTISCRGLDGRTRVNIYRFLLLGWPCEDIAAREGVSRAEVYRIKQNLKLYGSTRKPRDPNVRLGQPPKISPEDKQALFDELFWSGWMYQDEIAYWLWMERGVQVHQSTVSRLLQKRE